MSKAVSRLAYDSATISVELSGVIDHAVGEGDVVGNHRGDPSAVSRPTMPVATSPSGKSNPMLFR